MLTDDDIAGIQADFGVLAAAVPMLIKRGTRSAPDRPLTKPYNAVASHYCTVLTMSQVKDAYLTSFSKSLIQSTKNPRVVLVPLPIPSGQEVKRGDYITVDTDDYQVLDLDNNGTYQFQRVCFCQYVQGGAV